MSGKQPKQQPQVQQRGHGAAQEVPAYLQCSLTMEVRARCVLCVCFLICVCVGVCAGLRWSFVLPTLDRNVLLINLGFSPPRRSKNPW